MDMLVDVGAQYDVNTYNDICRSWLIDRMRFDHHQPTFVDTFSESYATRLSSAGLIYKYIPIVPF